MKRLAIVVLLSILFGCAVGIYTVWSNLAWLNALSQPPSQLQSYMYMITESSPQDYTEGFYMMVCLISFCVACGAFVVFGAIDIVLFGYDDQRRPHQND